MPTIDPATLICRVITVSDRCHAGVATDVSGPRAAALLSQHGLTVQDVVVVPDGVVAVRAAIEQAVADGVRMVLTTGGTGVSPRDLTPEATAPLLTLRLEGIESAIRDRGRDIAPAALLSRGLVGLIGRDAQAVLVVNAPGSPGGAADAVAVVAPLVSHLFGQLAGQGH